MKLTSITWKCHPINPKCKLASFPIAGGRRCAITSQTGKKFVVTVYRPGDYVKARGRKTHFQRYTFDGRGLQAWLSGVREAA